MSSKLVLTASAAVFGIFGAGWLIVPERFYKFWAIVPDTKQYMGRYGAFMLGLMVISWLARNAPNTQARRAIVVAVVAMLAISSLPPLLAHHDVGAAYDVCKTVTLDGVVTGLEWRHPHVVLHLNVIGTDRKTLAWAVATPAPSVLNREGLNDFFTKTGDHVTAHVFVAKDGSRDAIAHELLLPNGRTVSVVMSPSSLREAQTRCSNK